MLESILEFNEEFVREKRYEAYETTKFPNKRLVILTCMDTRLVELLPQAMNVRNGDIKIVKNAGAVISHPFGSIMRSLLVAVYELQADEVMIIGHDDCGFGALRSDSIMGKMVNRGIEKETFEVLKYSGVDVETWFKGFDTVEASVANSVEILKNHPLMVQDVPVHGLVINPGTGKLRVVIDGYVQ